MLSKRYRNAILKKKHEMDTREETSATKILEREMERIAITPSKDNIKGPMAKMKGSGMPKKISKAELINTKLLLT